MENNEFNTMEGYDYSPKVGGGKFFSYGSKGDSVKFRIVSPHKHEPSFRGQGKDGKWVYTTQENDPKLEDVSEVSRSENFYWLALDRSESEPVVKVLKGGVSVYLQIKELIQGDWGDPIGYDIKLENTGKTGKDKYSVTPLPNSKALTEEEIKAIRGCTIVLEDEMDSSKKDSTSLETTDESMSDKELDKIADELNSDEEEEDDGLPF